MASQIPYDHQIWDLTPTELKIAYLSLSMSKKEIATHLVTKENNVGTHLTNIFSKLGITGIPDEEKRPLLKEKFGRTIETLVADVGGDYEVEYRDIRRAALEKREEIKRQTQPVRVPPGQSGMTETPPEPLLRLPLSKETLSRRDLTMLGFGFTAGICLLGALFFGGNRLFAAQNDDPTQVFTANPSQSSSATQIFPSRTPTSNVSSTPEASSTSTLSPTPEIPPTAIPLPIREDFNTQYDPVWTVSGDPLLATASERGKYLGYDGVLTVRIRDRAAIAIGNTAWTDYIILLRANNITSYGDVLLEVSFRMKDLNNRIVLSCNYGDCDWIVVWNGVKDVLKEYDPMLVNEKLEITVVGDLFTATSINNYSTQLGLPPKYQGQFDGGGVMVELFEYELDFIEIQEFR